MPASSSSNTVSNLDITGVSEIAAKSEETPRKKIKLNVSPSSDESDSELTSSSKRLKSNLEDIPVINRSLTVTPKKAPKAAKASATKKRESKSKKADTSMTPPSPPADKNAKTSGGTKRRKNKSPINLNLSEELNMTTATGVTNEGEASINEVSRVSTSTKKSRVIKPIRQSLNDSTTSTRHSSRNSKTGNQFKVLTTGIVLSEREQQVSFKERIIFKISYLIFKK